MIAKEFVTAGNATFTVEPTAAFVEANRCKPHYTFKVRRSKDEHPQYGATYFLSMLTGPDNTSDYQYLGIVNPATGAVKLTKASRFAANSVPVRIAERVINAIIAGRGDAIEAAGWKVHHEGCCGRCGRALTVPASIESGIGPECAAKMGM